MPSAESRACCVIVPAYREEKRIGRVVRGILAHCPNVLVVDDGSDDRTAEEARAAGAEVIRHPGNRGKGSALNTGFERARQMGCEFVITVDGDGQHDPADLPAFMETYRKAGTPVLVGNRMDRTETMPWHRLLTNRFMSWLLSREMGQYVPDTQCGFRLYRSDVVPYVSAESQRFAAESEILLHIADRGIRLDCVRIPAIYGEEESKINPVKDSIRFLGMLRAYHKRKRAARREAR